jgi:signal transduction histidine kinase/CheY-like chemotaxis protein
VVLAQYTELGAVVALGVFYYFFEYTKLVSQVLILSLYVFVINVATQTGGIHSIALERLGVIPSSTLLLGSETALLWWACSLLIVTGMAWRVTDPVFFAAPELAEYGHWGALNLFAMSVGFGWFVILYEDTNNRHLRELEQQKEELTQAQTQLTQAQSHKDEFIAVVSHELRTPLNAVLGFTELMRESVGTSTQKIIDQIRKASFDLLQIITDILDFSQLQIDRVKLIYDRLYPDKLIHTASRRHMAQAQKKGLTIAVQIQSSMPETIWADEFRLSQAFDQLLSNAIKFTDQGQITITASGDETHLFVDIADQGIGIDQQQLDSIFDGFQHASAEVQHRYGGTGLGLAICKKIIELHQGQIEVRSELGQGTVFRLTVPTQVSHVGEQLKTLSQTAVEAEVLSSPAQPKRLGHWIEQWVNRYTEFERFYIMIMLGLVVSMFYYSITAPFEQGVWICFALCVSYMVSMLMVAIGHYLVVSVNLMSASSTVAIMAMSLYEIGVFSPTAGWLVILLAPSLYLLDRSQSLRWFVILMGVIFLLGELSTYDWLLRTSSTPAVSTLWSASGHISIMSLMLILPLLHKFYRIRSKRVVIQQNDALEHTREELLAQHKIKDQFIATVTHALRTPMNLIIGFNDLMRDEIKDRTELLAMQEMVSQSAQHLLTVIDDILDYSQLMTGQVNLKPQVFELPKVITHAFQMFGATQHRSNVSLSLEIGDVPQWVRGDVQRLTQILVNLLSNAMKFTAHGQVTLSVTKGSQGVEFVVSDTGVGIAEEKIEQIFEQYEQVNQRKNRRLGHGLGLSITRRLIRAQHGSIRVHSELGRGTKFMFNLQFATASAPTAQLPAIKSIVPSQKGICILVVDDQPLNRTLVKAVLRKVWPDVELIEAIHGLDALEKVKTHVVNLILMDMLMPEMDGVSATIKIRQDMPAPLCDIPVIGLTANANESTRQQCLQAGMNEIIYKPFNRDELLKCIEMWLGKNREAFQTKNPSQAGV